MKYRIKERPTGYISVNGGPLTAWPEEGELVDLSPAQAADMIRSGHVEPVEDKPKLKPETEPVAEKRPAVNVDAETRAPAKKASKRGESRKG